MVSAAAWMTAFAIAATPSIVTAKQAAGTPASPPRGTIETFYVPAIMVDGIPVLTRQNRWWDGSRWRPFNRPLDPPIPTRQRRME